MNNIEKLYWEAIKEYFETFEFDTFVFQEPGIGLNKTQLIAKYYNFDDDSDEGYETEDGCLMTVKLKCDCEKFNFVDDFYSTNTLFFDPYSKIGNYEPDFIIGLLDDPNSVQFAIEIDGFEYHDKTKEQAAKDKQKDRFYLSYGYIPIRFAGVEVYRNPVACVRETIQIILNTIGLNKKRDEFAGSWAIECKRQEAMNETSF